MAELVKQSMIKNLAELRNQPVTQCSMRGRRACADSARSVMA